MTDINGDNNNVTIYNGIDSNVTPSTIDDEFAATTGFDDIDRENLLTSIQSLSIGNNKDWVDSKFGPATFTRTIDDEYYECVYATDVAVIRVFYDISTSSCQAFFVTSYNLKPSEKIEYPKYYSSIVSEKALGEFSYYEIDLSPDKVFGFTTSGPGRAFYGEQYYYYPYIGTFYTFYFMTMDYGSMESFRQFSDELDNFGAEEYIDDEVSRDKVSYDMCQNITNRNSFYPNTYGISDIRDEEKIVDWISDYFWFDSLQLRDDIGNDWSQ